MTYSDIEKAAIVSILVELANADGNPSKEENDELNRVNHELDISQESYNLGLTMQLESAQDIIRKMDSDKKLHVGILMNRMIEADGLITKNEIKVHESIGHNTGINIVIDNKK